MQLTHVLLLRVACVVALLCGGAALAYARSAPELTRKGRIEALGANPSPAALARRDRSIAQLAAEGIPTLADLPVIADQAGSLRRDQAAIVRRTIALTILAVKGETGDQEGSRRLITQFGADDFFTRGERTFIDAAAPSQMDRTNVTWRYEAVHVLLWALGIYDTLGKPDHITDVPRLAEVLRDLGIDRLLEKAQLRPQSELLDAADLIYRTHWAMVQARLEGTPAPAGYHPDVVYERHYTLNWLIGHMDQPWDEITTDT